MTEPRIYATPTWLWLGLPAVFTLGAGYYAWQTPNTTERILIGIAVPVIWFLMLRDPMQAFLDTDALVLKSVLATTRIPLAEIQIIERSNRGTRIIHRRGKTTVANLTGDMDTLWAELQRRNPAITIQLDPLARFGQSPRRVLLFALVLALIPLVLVALLLNLPGLREWFR